MIIGNDMYFRSHHHISTDNSIVWNNTIFTNTTVITYFYISSITKIGMSINSGNFTTILEYSATTKYSLALNNLQPKREYELGKREANP